MKGEQQTWSSWVMAVPQLLARMLIPAGTSLRKIGENKNPGGNRKKRGSPGFFIDRLPSGWVPDGAGWC